MVIGGDDDYDDDGGGGGGCGDDDGDDDDGGGGGGDGGDDDDDDGGDDRGYLDCRVEFGGHVSSQPICCCFGGERSNFGIVATSRAPWSFHTRNRGGRNVWGRGRG
eukprot:3696958-Pyramimonas_sp.AAC.1